MARPYGKAIWQGHMAAAAAAAAARPMFFVGKGKLFQVIENGGDHANKLIVECSTKKEAYSIAKMQGSTQQWQHNGGIPLFLCPAKYI